MKLRIWINKMVGGVLTIAQQKVVTNAVAEIYAKNSQKYGSYEYRNVICYYEVQPSNKGQHKQDNTPISKESCK